MTPADYFVLGFTAAIILGAGIAWTQLEKLQRHERRRWERSPLLTEQEIIDRATRRRT
jgi:hypothetical protein